jgi:hypothetical protein
LKKQVRGVRPIERAIEKRTDDEAVIVVTKSYWSGLFFCYDVSDLPRTNNDLEHIFGSTRAVSFQKGSRRVLGSSGGETLPANNAVLVFLAEYSQINVFNLDYSIFPCYTEVNDD